MSTKLHIRTDDMGEQVGHGEVGEVHVGGRVHVLVLHDDEARDDVAEHAHGEDDRVERADRDVCVLVVCVRLCRCVWAGRGSAPSSRTGRTGRRAWP